MVEGSNDGRTWLPYDSNGSRVISSDGPLLLRRTSRDSTGRCGSPPSAIIAATHGLEIQSVRLAQGAPGGAGFAQGPHSFPQKPPRYLRAVLYEYHFTDFATRHATGDWWRRERKGLDRPELSLRQNSQN